MTNPSRDAPSRMVAELQAHEARWSARLAEATSADASDPDAGLRLRWAAANWQRAFDRLERAKSALASREAAA